jgi:hypothetical protein
MHRARNGKRDTGRPRAAKNKSDDARLFVIPGRPPKADEPGIQSNMHYV